MATMNEFEIALLMLILINVAIGLAYWRSKRFRFWFRRNFMDDNPLDPNSPSGLRQRADKLVKEGYEEDNPYVTALRKLAWLKEEDRMTENEEIEKEKKAEQQ